MTTFMLVLTVLMGVSAFAYMLWDYWIQFWGKCPKEGRHNWQISKHQIGGRVDWICTKCDAKRQSPDPPH